MVRLIDLWRFARFWLRLDVRLTPRGALHAIRDVGCVLCERTRFKALPELGLAVMQCRFSAVVDHLDIGSVPHEKQCDVLMTCAHRPMEWSRAVFIGCVHICASGQAPRDGWLQLCSLACSM